MFELKINFKGFKLDIKIGGKVNEKEEDFKDTFNSFNKDENKSKPMENEFADIVSKFSNGISLSDNLENMTVEDLSDSTGLPLPELPFPEPLPRTLHMIEGILKDTTLSDPDVLTAIAIDYEAGLINHKDLLEYRELRKLEPAFIYSPGSDSPCMNNEAQVSSDESTVEDPPKQVDLVKELNDTFDENNDINIGIETQRKQFEADLLRFGVPPELIEDMPLQRVDPNNMPCGSEDMDERGE